MARDLKRARSRHAAQNRRLSENSEFEQLASSLPIARPISSQLLDKASIVRLTIAKLKLAHFSYSPPHSWRQPVITSAENDGMETFWWSQAKIGTRILEALDGFLFCLSPNGTVLYVSETVSIGLGLSQIEMIGNQISNYLHKRDSKTFEQVVWPLLTGSNQQSQQKSLCIRLKSGLSKRACKDATQTAGYKVVNLQIQQRVGQGENLGVCGLGFVLPCSMSGDYRLDRSSFVITAHLNLKIHYIDIRGAEILGWDNEPTWVRGKSLYSLIHAQDIHLLAALHNKIIDLGGCTSDYFRILRHGGGTAYVYSIGMRVHKQKCKESLNFLTLCCTLIALKDNDSILDSCQI